MKTRVSSVLIILLTAAAANAESFYGLIRFSNDGIQGSGITLSTSAIGFFSSSSQPEAIVQLAGGGPDPGPVFGSAVELQDFTPGSMVSDFLTIAGWSHVFDGSTSPPLGLFFYPPPFPANPSSCVAVGPFFCVEDLGGDASAAFFAMRGIVEGQRGYWEASFGALVLQPADTVRAELAGGQTVVSNAWTADVLAFPEPATSVTVLTSIGLLLVARRKLRNA